MIVTSITEFKDTIVTNYINTTSSVNVTTITSTDNAANPLIQDCYNRVPTNVDTIAEYTTVYDYWTLPATKVVRMQGTITQLPSNTMCAPAAWQCLKKIHTDGSIECHRMQSTYIQRLRF